MPSLYSIVGVWENMSIGRKRRSKERATVFTWTTSGVEDGSLDADVWRWGTPAYYADFLRGPSGDWLRQEEAPSIAESNGEWFNDGIFPEKLQPAEPKSWLPLYRGTFPATSTTRGEKNKVSGF